MTLAQRYETERDGQNPMFGRRNSVESERTKHLFESIGSHGANKKRLSQLCATWDFVIAQLGWEVTLSQIVTGYQASIDAKFHDDYKAVATIEELDRRLAMRRSAAYKQNDINEMR